MILGRSYNCTGTINLNNINLLLIEIKEFNDKYCINFLIKKGGFLSKLLIYNKV